MGVPQSRILSPPVLKCAYNSLFWIKVPRIFEIEKDYEEFMPNIEFLIRIWKFLRLFELSNYFFFILRTYLYNDTTGCSSISNFEFFGGWVPFLDQIWTWFQDKNSEIKHIDFINLHSLRMIPKCTKIQIPELKYSEFDFAGPPFP